MEGRPGVWWDLGWRVESSKVEDDGADRRSSYRSPQLGFAATFFQRVGGYGPGLPRQVLLHQIAEEFPGCHIRLASSGNSQKSWRGADADAAAPGGGGEEGGVGGAS